jgi:hypothetical protein
MPKPFKSKTSILFTILFHKICIHTTYLRQIRCFHRSQTPTYILLKQKKKKKLKYTHHMTPHGSTCESTWTLKLKWQRVFTWQRP